MEKILIRTGAAAIVLALFVAFGAAQSSYAAMGDRSPAGAIAVSPNSVVNVPENKEVKFNFGKNYDYQSFYYFRIVPSNTGYITFVDDYTHSTSLALCDENKNLISSGDPAFGDFFSWNSQFPYQTFVNYGVKKGKAYLIRVKGASTERASYDQPYIGTVKWTNTKVKTSKYGKKQKKAASIKRGKTVKGVIQAGSTKAQWYKVKVKGKKAKVTFTSKYNCGSIVAEIRYKSYGTWFKNRLTASRSDDFWKRGGVFTSNKKGSTFYIRVYPDKKTSGYYTLKWK